MSDERIIILKMLEEGRISSEDATKLLDAISKDNKVYTEKEGVDSHDTSIETFTNDLGRKIEAFTKGFEPKLYKITETLVEKTTNMADKIAQSIPVIEMPKRYKPVNKNILEHTFEIRVPEGYNELNLSSFNGDIRINGYSGDLIKAKVNYIPKSGGANIDLLKLGEKYILNYNEDMFEYVSIDAYVPKSLFRNINIQCINGIAYVSSIKTEYLTLNNLNNNSEIKDIESGIVKIDANNGSLKATNLMCKSCKFEISNGNLNINNFDIENLYISAFNSNTNIDLTKFNKFNGYIWNIESSNGLISMKIPSTPDIGYYIKAQTSLNNVNVGLTGLDYILYFSSYVEAKSVNYDVILKHVNINAETSNAPINIS